MLLLGYEWKMIQLVRSHGTGLKEKCTAVKLFTWVLWICDIHALCWKKCRFIQVSTLCPEMKHRGSFLSWHMEQKELRSTLLFQELSLNKLPYHHKKKCSVKCLNSSKLDNLVVLMLSSKVLCLQACDKSQ